MAKFIHINIKKCMQFIHNQIIQQTINHQIQNKITSITKYQQSTENRTIGGNQPYLGHVIELSKFERDPEASKERRNEGTGVGERAELEAVFFSIGALI